VNTAEPQTLFRERKQTERESWQDKQPLKRFLSASDKPQTAMTPQEPQKKHGSEKRQTAHLSGRCKTVVKDKLMDIAKERGWTESFIVSVAAEQFVENSIGLKLGAVLAATVTKAIDENMEKRENREAKLLARNWKTTEETWTLLCKVLLILLNHDTDLRNKYRDEAQTEALRSITHGEK
jgi:hypothetical protein